MSLAVVLCTYRRPERLEPLLRQVVAQLPEDGEVWVIDQSPGEEAARGQEAVDALDDPRVRWVERQPPGLPGARNEGIRRSRADVLLFLDDDVSLQPGCLDAHLEAMADPTVGGVVGRIVEERVVNNATSVVNHVGRDGRVRCFLDGDAVTQVGSLKGANMSWRRQALAQAGPFDEAYGGTALLEESDRSEAVRMLGWRLVYAPSAGVIHHHDPTGGVRVGSAVRTERWRFENTGYFVGRHRPLRHLPLVTACFGAIALKRGLEWREPHAPVPLVAALLRGWWRGRRSPGA